MTAPRILVLSFIGVILVGTALLALPFSTRGGGISFIDAFYTATSATCVTGLVVFNTADTFTIFGQIVILLLIQLGGIGTMTLSTSIYLIFSNRMTLRTRLNVADDLGQPDMSNLRSVMRRILLMTFVTETVGAILLTIGFSAYYDFGHALWSGIFHSVSAFCNAGFDIVTIGAGSMVPFNDNPLIMLTVCLLIVVGGIGFLVVSDIFTTRRPRRWRLHTKIVLGVTAGLILLGTALFLGVEYHNPKTLGGMGFGQKLLNALFHSITCRTAGFNSIDIGGMTEAGLAGSMVLMFIGASPGSTGGGIKTTTLFVFMALLAAVVRQRKDVVIDKRKISENTIARAASVVFLAMLIMALSAVLLGISENGVYGGQQLLFEQISAYGTVGLSMGITGGLNAFSKIVLIISMFLGRVGALSFFLSFTKGKRQQAQIEYLDANVIV